MKNIKFHIFKILRETFSWKDLFCDFNLNFLTNANIIIIILIFVYLFYY